jgi:hypothetical protein
MVPQILAETLPHELPACPNARVALYVVRRMGAQGLADAMAVQAMIAAFGKQFRRPLTLLRAFLSDMAEAADGTIAIAPCCCPRTTGAEAAILRVLARAETDPGRARLLMADLLGVGAVDGVLASAAAVGAAFADEGRPICA